jgi:hypothetical protein
MIRADLIQRLPVLMEIIIAGGAEFIAVKKQKRFGWAISAIFGLFCNFRSLTNGNVPYLCRD